jgi:hypothetical protein
MGSHENRYRRQLELRLCFFHATIVCLIVLSIGILIAHAFDALRT